MLVFILAIALIIRIIGILPNIPYPDEAHIQVYSYKLVENILTKGDFHPHTFKYGSFIFYFQTAVSMPIFVATYLWEGLTKDFVPFGIFVEEASRKYANILVFSGRLSIAVVGVLNVYLVYKIAEQLFNKKVAQFSALILAVAPMHVRDSHYMITDIIFLFWMLVTIYCFVQLFKTKKLMWFVFSGIFLGFSSTIRFYPIAAFAYPLALLFSFEKKGWIRKVIISLLGSIVGVFLGVPYLFLDPQAIHLLAYEFQRYALPWYETPTSFLILSKVFSILSGGSIELQKSILLYPAPTGFRPLHSSWIFFNGIGPIPSILALMGLAYLFVKSFKKFIFLFIIPFIYFLYISFTIPAIYEKLSMPILPFLAIFAAVALEKLSQKLKNRKIILAGLVTITIVPQLFKSTQASYACGQIAIQKQSSQWVEYYIPDGSNVAYLASVSVPSTKDFPIYKQLDLKNTLSLSEASNMGANYVLYNAGRLDYETYPIFNDYFITPRRIYENTYEYLTWKEYQENSKLLNKIDKPMMCDTARIYYYKLPNPLKAVTTPISTFDFSTKDQMDSWKIDKYETIDTNLTFDKEEGYTKPGSILFQKSKTKYGPPRLYSDEITIQPGKTYTFKFWVKTAKSENVGSVVARLDFYETQAAEKVALKNNINSAILLLWEGSTPIYFEKNSSSDSVNSNTSLPGKKLTLSPRQIANTEWQEIVVTQTAPANTDTLVLSILNIQKEISSIYIDDIQLFE